MRGQIDSAPVKDCLVHRHAARTDNTSTKLSGSTNQEVRFEKD